MTTPRNIARYIGRYLRHPAIAESRISNFDIEANAVTYWFVEDGVKVFVTLPALEFIDRLVKLIPDKNFKLIRYYGLYSRRTSAKIQKMLTPLIREERRFELKKEVVKCPKCGQIMDLVSAFRPYGDEDEDFGL